MYGYMCAYMYTHTHRDRDGWLDGWMMREHLLHKMQAQNLPETSQPRNNHWAVTVARVPGIKVYCFSNKAGAGGGILVLNLTLGLH